MILSPARLAAALIAVSISAAPLASAQTRTPPDTQRSAACYQAAREHQLQGETRVAFLQDCLNGRATARESSGPETCAARAKKADAQKLKDAARTLFMSGCLKRS
ncbi:MAG TPA: hypothetical protein VET85_03040 [Stellaceae bacterium]|nr:hypothetical protein [Stellaceae bacterium]